jgi:hypothetical protein
MIKRKKEINTNHRAIKDRKAATPLDILNLLYLINLSQLTKGRPRNERTTEMST